MSRVDMKAAGLVQGPENLLFLATRTQSRPGTRHILSQGCEEAPAARGTTQAGPRLLPGEPIGWPGPAPRARPAVALLSWISCASRGAAAWRPTRA